MPTVITHALLPLIGAAAVGPPVSTRLAVAGMACAILPDADLISRWFDIPHTADLGHRGATHTILFALLMGALGAGGAASFRTSRAWAAGFLFLATLSHPLADMLTDGGKGIMLFWPLSDKRFRWLVHPVDVSPIGVRSLINGTLDDILLSELVWLVLPALLLAVLYRLVRRPYIDSGKGQS